MLHEVKSAYRDIARYFPDLKKKIPSSVLKKRTLLRMARSGRPRPNITNPLGTALSSYTLKSSGSYDPVFDNEIRRLAPNWFVSKAERSDRKKKLLLEMARKGKNKPGAKTKMGRAYYSYISPNNNSYDPIFTKDIKKLAPDWFVSSVDLNKRQLLKMANNKKPKPNIKTKLGSALYCYTSPNNRRYDPVFSKKISILAPSWLPRSQIADKKKKQFLEMARKGMPKPDRRSKLGRSFWSYVYASQKNSYDPKFAREIKRLAPHWFRKCSTK